jgi:hypothetical protein
MMVRWTYLFCSLLVSGLVLALSTPALAGVEPTPTATATATAEPTPTATNEPTPTATATAEPTPTATNEPTPTATATATAEPTPTATAEPTPTATNEPTPTPTNEPTPTATNEPTPTPTPGASNCLCEVIDITPGQISLRNVGTPGAKGSKLTKNVTVILDAVDAPGARCKPNEFSDPTPVNLRMVDDTGDVLVDRSKSVVCSGRPNELTAVKIPVKFEGPNNCKDGAVPTGNKPSTGNIASTATGSPGTPVYQETTRIKCKD